MRGCPAPSPANLPADLAVGYSELHVFRGLETPAPGFIFGHEFTGTVVEAGAEVKSAKVGDKVVAPFTVSWYVMDPRHTPVFTSDHKQALESIKRRCKRM